MDSEASRSCGPRCRPPPGELAGGRRSKPSPRFFAVGVTPSRPAARGGAGVNSGVPSPERSAPLRSSVPGLSLSSSAPHQGGAWLGEQKLMAANYVRCPRDRGESVKGGHPPFHKKTTSNRNSPKPHAEGVQGSCVRFPSQAAGSRVPRPLLLRGLRAALAALRKRGAERTAPSPWSLFAASLSSSAPHQGGALGEQKLMAANYVRCPRDRGESVKGGHPPFHKKTTKDEGVESELAAARRRRARELRSRRGAPGGSGTGARRREGV